MSTSSAAEKSLYAIFYFLPLFRQLQIDLNPSIRFQTRRNFKLPRRFPDGDRTSRMISTYLACLHHRPDVWKEHKSAGLPRSRPTDRGDGEGFCGRVAHRPAPSSARAARVLGERRDPSDSRRWHMDRAATPRIVDTSADRPCNRLHGRGYDAHPLYPPGRGTRAAGNGSLARSKTAAA